MLRRTDVYLFYYILHIYHTLHFVKQGIYSCDRHSVSHLQCGLRWQYKWKVTPLQTSILLLKQNFTVACFHWHVQSSGQCFSFHFHTVFTHYISNWTITTWLCVCAWMHTNVKCRASTNLFTMAKSWIFSFVYKNCEKCPSRFHKAQADYLKSSGFIQLTVQKKRYSVYYHRPGKNINGNIHISEAKTREFLTFCLKKS